MTPAMSLESRISVAERKIENLHDDRQRQESTLVRIEQKIDTVVERQDSRNFKFLLALAGWLVTGLGTLAAVLLKK